MAKTKIESDRELLSVLLCDQGKSKAVASTLRNVLMNKHTNQLPTVRAHGGNVLGAHIV